MIKETIDSVLTQTFGDFELVVVDDGSTDKTRETIDYYLRIDPRIRYLAFETNRGYLAANNRCYEEACGEIIYVFDSDDVMRADNLQARYELLREKPEVGLLYSDASLIDEEGQILAESFWEVEGYKPLRGKLNGEMIALFGLFAPHCGWCIRREVFEKLGPQVIDIPYSHDAYYLLRVAGRFEIDYIERQLVCIVGRSSITSKHHRICTAVKVRRLYEEFPM
jgi:glycosyltransferase involved in cell wall biosynthesis